MAVISDDWVAPLHAAGVTVRTRIVEDTHPLIALAGTARDEDAGLIVVGTRGLSKVGALRLGRLPLQLVHHTHLPVVLVPPTDRG
jgi:nucleotide-binding universal stress UspA family protein